VKSVIDYIAPVKGRIVNKSTLEKLNSSAKYEKTMQKSRAHVAGDKTCSPL